MKVFYGFAKVKKINESVITLGVFDGVHLGHQKIIKATVEKARQIKGKSVVITFWPHPQKQSLLLPLEQRLQLIAKLGVDFCIVVKFTPSFARIKAVDFVKDFFVKRLSVKYIYIGKDFKFGAKKEGSLALLKKLAAVYRFKVKGIDVLKYRGVPISSTLLRALIKEGKIERASCLLGRYVSISGKVVRGISFGKTLGFPTANIAPCYELIPADGVYAVKVIFGNKEFKGACYIGRKPTLDLKKNKRYVEVHILNFRKNIYHKNLELRFIKKIRSEQKFPSLSALRLQIQKDIAEIKKFFS